MSDLLETINIAGQAILAEEGANLWTSELRQIIGLAGYTASVFALGQLTARINWSAQVKRFSNPATRPQIASDSVVACDDLLTEIKIQLDSHSDSTRRLNEHLESSDHDVIRDQAKATREENSQFKTFLDDRCIQLESHAENLRGALKRVLQGLAGHRERASELDDVLAKFEDCNEIESAITPLRECIQKLHSDNQRLQSELNRTRQAVSQQSQKLEQAHEEARIDALTGLANRRAFDEQIRDIHTAYQNDERPYVVAILDVDHFKLFNDEHGHATGDKVLEVVAKVLRSTQRNSDHVARFGGEEFAILLPFLSGEHGKSVVDRHRAKIEKASLLLNGKNLHITVSAGMAEVRPSDSIETVIARADAALYAAKAAGRNQTCLEDDGEIVYFNQLRPPEALAVSQ